MNAYCTLIISMFGSKNQKDQKFLTVYLMNGLSKYEEVS